jgi:hypothetical protein
MIAAIKDLDINEDRDMMTGGKLNYIQATKNTDKTKRRFEN